MSIIESNTKPSNNFQREFGRMSDNAGSTEKASASGRANDRPNAKLWINIGVTTTVTDPNSGEPVEHFVALPMGLPLDTMSKLDVKGGTEDYRARLTAQNDLLDAVLKKAEDVAPGETKLFTIGGKGLSVQIRRAKVEAAPIAPDQNQYTVDLGF